MEKPVKSNNELLVEYSKSISEEHFRKERIFNGTFMDWLHAALCQNKTIIYDSNEEKERTSEELCTGLELVTLFNIVQNYANNHYIVSTMDNDGVSYYVKYNGIIIKVGYYVEDDKPIHYAKRVILRKRDEVIILSFENIKEDTLLDDSMYGERRELIELYNFVKNLKYSGFTDEEIVNTTNKALKYVR